LEKLELGSTRVGRHPDCPGEIANITFSGSALRSILPSLPLDPDAIAHSGTVARHGHGARQTTTIEDTELAPTVAHQNTRSSLDADPGPAAQRKMGIVYAK
jgi:hypothetical protein